MRQGKERKSEREKKEASCHQTKVEHDDDSGRKWEGNELDEEIISLEIALKLEKQRDREEEGVSDKQ